MCLRLWIAFTFVVAVQAVSPLVDLSHVRYEGTALRNGVTQWLGMRYAAAPVGQLRFAPPRDPLAHSKIQRADKHGKLCLATKDAVHNPRTSEDCLFIDVFAPSDATPQSRLPVYFFIQGGGFNHNSNANYNGTGLVKASGGRIIVVTFNYRVGPYGFLASSEIQKSPTASINNGLRDQRKALEWVQRHISVFGGNSDQVVLGGDSAGAASISLHLTAFGGHDDELFHAAAAESVSFATLLTVAESQYQFDHFAARLNCAGRSDVLSCLRSKSAVALQQNNYNVPYPGAEHPPLYMWGPVIDHDLIQDYTYRAFDQGNFIKVPSIFGDDTNGGTIFTPRHTNSLSESDTFLHDQFFALTKDQLSRINKLYPNPGTTFPNSGSYWRQVSNAYGELRYTCPGLFISSAFERHGVNATWNYRYNVEDPQQMKEGLGVPHTAEINAIWGPENVGGRAPASYNASGSNSWVVPVMQGYWTSFVRSLDPNVHRHEGSPEWDEWTVAGMERMLFEKGNTGMEKVDTGQATRCNYLNGIGVDIKQR